MINEEEIDENDEIKNEKNESYNRLMPREFLKRIPGINSYNIQKIINNVKNMIELVKMSEDQLSDLIGQKSAKMVKDFLDFRPNH